LVAVPCETLSEHTERYEPDANIYIVCVVCGDRKYVE